MTYRYLVIAALLGAGCVDQPGAIVCPTGIVCPDGTTCAAAQPVCIVNPCGNGRVEPGETCDDGNTTAGDGCNATCQVEVIPEPEPCCGDGHVDAGEECDDGNTTGGDGCDSVCKIEHSCPTSC